MNEVFADSFYFLALLDRDDEHHSLAVQAARNLRSRIITTHWVLVEVGDALSAPHARQRTHRFLNQIGTESNTVVISDFSWFERGLALYGKRPDKDWSLTDCISFCVMEARAIREALTGDHHFEQAGYVALLAGNA